MLLRAAEVLAQDSKGEPEEETGGISSSHTTRLSMVFEPKAGISKNGDPLACMCGRRAALVRTLAVELNEKCEPRQRTLRAYIELHPPPRLTAPITGYGSKSETADTLPYMRSAAPA